MWICAYLLLGLLGGVVRLVGAACVRTGDYNGLRYCLQTGSQSTFHQSLHTARTEKGMPLFPETQDELDFVLNTL